VILIESEANMPTYLEHPPDADADLKRRPPPVEPRKHVFGKVVLVIGAIGAAIYVAQNIGSGPAAPQTPAEAKINACRADWHKCEDNSQMANNWNGWSHVKGECKDAANQMAKYGDPKWPWLAFSSFYGGSSYTSGKVTVIEPDAQFQNGFGAMAHVQVVCDYDLNQKTVLNVSLNPR
jgi:hypothetical protein